MKMNMKFIYQLIISYFYIYFSLFSYNHCCNILIANNDNFLLFWSYFQSEKWIWYEIYWNQHCLDEDIEMKLSWLWKFSKLCVNVTYYFYFLLLCQLLFLGYYCPMGQSIAAPFMCRSGYYCPEGSHEEIHCPSGTYQDETGQGQCKECPSGWLLVTTIIYGIVAFISRLGIVVILTLVFKYFWLLFSLYNLIISE